MRNERDTTDSAARPPVEEQDWMRPEDVGIVWPLVLALLAATVIVQLIVPLEEDVGVGPLIGFNAVYGFLTCAAMVIVAKILGWWLERPDDYYPDKNHFLWSATPTDPERPKYEKIDA